MGLAKASGTRKRRDKKPVLSCIFAVVSESFSEMERQVDIDILFYNALS
jgi:hypothetical protein